MSKVEIKKLEEVQKRATKMIIELKAIKYEMYWVQIFQIFKSIEKGDIGAVYSQGTQVRDTTVNK